MKIYLVGENKLMMILLNVMHSVVHTFFSFSSAQLKYNIKIHLSVMLKSRAGQRYFEM